MGYDVVVEFEVGVGIRVVCRADAVMHDENLGVIEMGEHNWDVFELVDMESRADFEVVFGSIVHDGSRGQVLEEDIIIDTRHFCRGIDGMYIGGRGVGQSYLFYIIDTP